MPPNDALPPWLQTLLYLGGIVGAFAAAWKGWISKGVAAKPSEAPNALIAGDIMSTKPMKDLAEAVEKLNILSKECSDREHEIHNRQLDAINRLNDSERATEQAVRDLCRSNDRSNDQMAEVLREFQAISATLKAQQERRRG